MLRQLHLLLSATAFASVALVVPHTGVRVSTRADDCSGYMFSKCELDLDGVLATLESANPEICQMICAEVYQGDCNVFYFNHNDTSCSLLMQNVEDHIRTCRQVGGTRSPSVDYCFSQTDPCYFFHDEACTTMANVIANLQNVESAAKCQRSCELDAKCLYFLYDVDIRRCQLLDGVEKTCSVTVGPSSPSYEECKAEQTTTPSPTTAPPTTTTTFTTTTSPTAPSQCTTAAYTKMDGQCACGFYLGNQLTWYQAREGCAAQGGRLPEVNSASENGDIFNLKPKDFWIWLGGTDEASEGNYVWESSGAPLTYTNWRSGDPDGGTSQNCISLGYYAANDWIDATCGFTYSDVATLCEVLFSCN